MQTIDQIPLRARLTTRLVNDDVGGLSTELRVVASVASAAGLSWTTVMRVLSATAALSGDVDRRLVRRLGIDEHRFRTVRYL